MGEKKERLTTDQKLIFLYKHKIIEKDTKPSTSTINRLYSFYQRNPLDTPIALAYGLSKRINTRVKKYGGSYMLKTPKYPITAERYIQKQAQQITVSTKKQISHKATLKSSIYRPYSKRMQDYLSYRYHITCNEDSLNKVLMYIQRNVLPTIKQDVEIVTQNFMKFYHTPLVGSIAEFSSQDFPMGMGENYQRVAFTRIYKDKRKQYIDFFIESLYESIKNGFLICLQYDKMTITLNKIEIVITSDLRATAYEKLRA